MVAFLVAMGSGGGLLQKFDRDTCKYAFKCSFAITDQGPVDVYKDPITDHGKRSKRGQLKLVEGESGLVTVPLSDPREDKLVVVFENGKLLVDESLETVRARAGV